jgi:hypothetical protein
MTLEFDELLGKVFRNRHNAIYDPMFQKSLKEAPWEQWLSEPGYFEVQDQYIERFIDWMYSSKRNKLTDGCKFHSTRYSRRDIIIGTTQSFDEAYFRYAGRRLRLFRGEYAYHRRVYKNHAWLDEHIGKNSNGDWADTVEPGDWVVLSHPFCGTGSEHPKMKELLDTCHALDVPVVLDCAWFGTCFDLEFDLNHPAITEVSFSLSKGIGLGNMRTGVRWSNYPKNDMMPIAQQNSYGHLVLSNCQLALHQMEQFSPDWQADKYLDWYKQLCAKYSMIESNCLHVTMLPRYHKDFEYFLIDESYVKVGIREALKAVRRGELKL